MPIRRRLFEGLSWRLEARAAASPAASGDRLRGCAGRMMALAGAHNHLPDIEQQAGILCFHGITERPDPQVEDNVLSLRNFRRLLNVLHRSFHVISLTELVACIRERRSPPPKSIVVTFDDGYACCHELAAGELALRRMPWSVFLPAGLIETGGRQWLDDVRVLIHRGGRKRIVLHWDGQAVEFDLSTPEHRSAAVKQIIEACRYLPEPQRRSRFDELLSLYSDDEIAFLREQYPSFAPMTWQQVRELKLAGVDVGSHGLSHIALAPQTSDYIRRELAAARDLLQERIGDHSPHFSYPYGRLAAMSSQTEVLIREMGYHCALTLEQEIVRCPSCNLMALPRLIVSAQVGRVLFGLWQRFL
ncbi:MAG TPA: polysaccharide deacetylase family protein [Phycisphaerae bacterium]|nr:polysaccharide deacetylase family protein [Phycisphaerae bacterium]HRR84730.1 polysaccharide deacetylase family protein [Phycisphaerae bacterium]